MTVHPTSRMRAVVTRGAGLLGVGALIAALQVSGPVLVTEPDPSPMVDRHTNLSRSLPDRLEVQASVRVSEDVDVPFRVATATAEAPPPEEIPEEERPICIASALEPGVFFISSTFGMRANPILGGHGLHAGVDFAAPMSTPIHAVADGVVSYTGAGQAGRSSELVIIDHEVDDIKFSSWYVHMYPGGVFVEAGQEVRAGEQIAEVGSNGFSTGPHLHLEIHTPVGGPTSGGMAMGALMPMAHEPPIDETTPEEEAPESTDAGPAADAAPEEQPASEESQPVAPVTAALFSPTGVQAPADPEVDSGAPAVDGTTLPGGDAQGEEPPATEGTSTPDDSDAQEGPDDERDPLGGDPAESEGDGSQDNPESEDSRGKKPRPEGDEDEDDDGDEDGTYSPDGSDFDIKVKNDKGENDHTIKYTVSRTTGFLDLGSLGMVHDPIPFLEALGYGFVAPSVCYLPVG